MRNKCFSFSLLLLVCMGWATWETEGRARPKVIDPATYPYFRDNPYLTGRMRAIMAPYLLPLDHPAKPILDMIFSQARVTESKKTLENAGFEIIASMKVSFITVARHPALPGLVFKIYLDTEKRRREELHQVEWLIKRCVNAEKIRTFIAKKKINYFTVPDKWLYILPERPVSRELNPQPLIVVETDMQLVSHGDTELAWKNYITPKMLDELYLILREGHGSVHLVGNVPFTKNGTFAFVDTEKARTAHKLYKVNDFLSKEMQDYWNKITK